MTAEPGLVERRSGAAAASLRHFNSKAGYVSSTIKKKSRCSKKRSKLPAALSMSPPSAPPSVLQQLFVSCRKVFTGPGSVPPPSHVHRISQILDKMKPEDVGLSRNLPFFRASVAGKGTPRVTYRTIYQCSEFWFCIFFLPATAVIPLHNHPGMTVFSKLLLGKMHIKSYDLVEHVGPRSDSSSTPSHVRRAKLDTDAVFTAPCDTSVLYPTTGGNIHQFTAITPCAVLDVMGPPYSKEDGRDCCYYRELKDHDPEMAAALREDGDECYGWLEEIEMPESSHMDREEYPAPQVI